jgi:Domain of unknown function (DUF4124)
MKRVLLCVALLACAGIASANVVYKWVDAQGKTLYGDRPPDGVKAEVVSLLGRRADRQAAASSSRAAPRPSVPSSAQPGQSEGQKSQQDTKKEVDADVAASRDKQCAEARDRYQKYIANRRLYKEGKNGEREYLSNEEIDAERLNAKRDADSVCGSST